MNFVMITLLGSILVFGFLSCKNKSDSISEDLPYEVVSEGHKLPDSGDIEQAIIGGIVIDLSKEPVHMTKITRNDTSHTVPTKECRQETDSKATIDQFRNYFNDLIVCVVKTKSPDSHCDRKAVSVKYSSEIKSPVSFVSPNEALLFYMPSSCDSEYNLVCGPNKFDNLLNEIAAEFVQVTPETCTDI